MKPSTYLIVLLFPSVVLLVGGGVFNGMVDPYGLFSPDGSPGWNDQKAHAYHQDRLFKVADVTRTKPDALLIGTSRVGMGMDPGHPALAEFTAYNFGLTGAKMEEVRRNLQHVQSVRDQRLVLLGLDFFMFDEASGPYPAFRGDRLRTDANGKLQLTSYYADLPPALWSWEATEASLDTISDSAEGIRAPRYDQGRFDDSPWEPNLAAQGHYVQFFMREKDFMQAFLDFRFKDRHGRSRQLAAFADCLRDCHRNGTDLRLFIAPIHARMLEVIRACDQWAASEEWRRDLARLNEEVAAEFDAEPFPLWDFTGYNELTAEVVPDFMDVQTRMRYYWEGSHFRKEMGDRVMDVILDHPTPTPLPPGFGRRMDGGNVETVLSQLRDEAKAWRSTNDGLVKDLEHRVAIIISVLTGEFDEDSLPPEQREAIEKMIDQFTR
jgi:hypothetical protein